MRIRLATIGLTLALVTTSALGIALAAGSRATVAASPVAATVTRAVARRAVPAAKKPIAKKVVWTADIGATYRVMREDGPHSPNRTDITGEFTGADTGTMFTYQGQTFTVFNDAHEGPVVPLGTNYFASPLTDWRSQTMALSSDNNPADGITYDSLITDTPNHAKALMQAKHDPTECCIYPTTGTAVGNRMYIHYLSTKNQGAYPYDDWTCNGSGIGYSDDGGQTWVKNPYIWVGNSNFALASFVQQGAFTYLFGVSCVTPPPGSGRVELARVPSTAILDPTAYRYWTGKTWSPNAKSATPMTSCCVQQFSVRYNSYYKKWIMLGGGTGDTGFELRTADALTGPWSQPQNFFNFDYPFSEYFDYAPEITPSWNNGPDIWFNISNLANYDVSLWHTTLTPNGAPSAPRSLSATSFAQASGSAKLTWNAPAKSNASKVTGYVVTAYYATDSTYEEQFSLPPVTFRSTATTQTITGLTTGTAYTFVVSAINSRGTGPVSVASNAVTPT
jgi:Domain of unknown function (DUF4185)/Fibronectin type III domain